MRLKTYFNMFVLIIIFSL